MWSVPWTGSLQVHYWLKNTIRCRSPLSNWLGTHCFWPAGLGLVIFSEGQERSYQTFIIYSWERRKALKIQQAVSKSLQDTDEGEMDAWALLSAGRLMDNDSRILLAHTFVSVLRYRKKLQIWTWKDINNSETLNLYGPVMPFLLTVNTVIFLRLDTWYKGFVSPWRPSVLIWYNATINTLLIVGEIFPHRLLLCRAGMKYLYNVTWWNSI